MYRRATPRATVSRSRCQLGPIRQLSHDLRDPSPVRRPARAGAIIYGDAWGRVARLGLALALLLAYLLTLLLLEGFRSWIELGLSYPK